LDKILLLCGIEKIERGSRRKRRSKGPMMPFGRSRKKRSQTHFIPFLEKYLMADVFIFKKLV
jgi:hypothetical protein